MQYGPSLGSYGLTAIKLAPDHPGSELDNERRLMEEGGFLEHPEPHRLCAYGKKLPKLVQLQQWISVKQRPRESITLMTQLSADR